MTPDFPLKLNRRLLAKLCAGALAGRSAGRAQSLVGSPEISSIYDCMTRHRLSDSHPPVPGMLLTLYGRRLAASSAQAPLTRTLPPTLADVDTVREESSAGYYGLQYVSFNQINLWLGSVNSYGFVRIEGSLFDRILQFSPSFKPIVHNSFGFQANLLQFTKRQSAPRVLEFITAGSWRPAIYQVRAAESETIWILNGAGDPAVPGDWIVVFGVGAGTLSLTLNDNQLMTGLASKLTDREGDEGFGVVLNGTRKIIPSAAVKAPNTFGVDQFNVQLPLDVAPGRYMLALSCTRWISPAVEFFVR